MSNANTSLYPISKAAPVSTRLLLFFKSVFTVLAALIITPLALIVISFLIVTGIAPLTEWYHSKQDATALDREEVLKSHPEMFLLEISADINKASNGKTYKLMVRLTKPTNPNDYPPIIMPGGLASNLMTMSRHQDELSKIGFTVVNFDRLGVGLSDAYDVSKPLTPPSAADVAREMNYVMTHIDGIDENVKWIQVGGSMGTNVATAFACLYPNRLCGFFNLDGLPHAFLQIQCKKFLKDGKMFMDILKKIQWTGLPRMMFTLALKPILPVIGDVFTKQQLIGVMCRDQFFVATGLEYTTLMSCCDLECAAWGKQATTELDDEGLRIMASLAPDESFIVNEGKGVKRLVTDKRSKSELGERYLMRQDREFVDFESKFHTLAILKPEEVGRDNTHCNWPQPPSHPVGTYVGGADKDTPIYPLAPQFKSMIVRIMCARDYTGLERDYTQEARNHAAARCTLQSINCDDCKVYYYPELSHLNLWQQVEEVVGIAGDIGRAILERKC
jgi:pimeloyl-ACP methyl ester carboxylesterase